MGDRAKAIHEFRQLVIAAGARDVAQAFASGRLAVQCGDRPVDVIASLQRNRPEMFDSKLASKRQRREVADNYPRHPASTDSRRYAAWRMER